MLLALSQKSFVSGQSFNLTDSYHEKYVHQSSPVTVDGHIIHLLEEYSRELDGYILHFLIPQSPINPLD